MPDKMELRAFPDVTQQHVSVQLLQNDVAVGQVLLDPAGIENFIALLARSRAALTVPVAAEFDPATCQLGPVTDPVWEIPEEQQPEGTLLAIQHPGLGWLSFIFPDSEAASISQWIVKDPSGPGR
jgi:hypothetical protein